MARHEQAGKLTFRVPLFAVGSSGADQMSGSLCDFLNQLSAAVLEPSADVLLGELVTNVLVFVSVEAWVADNAHDDAVEVMLHAVWERGKGFCDEFLNQVRVKEQCKRAGTSCAEEDSGRQKRSWKAARFIRPLRLR